jgi:hypothetical protein
MSKIEKRVHIDGRLERLFAYVPELSHSPEIWPGLLEVGEVEYLPLGGAIARWLYKTGGVIVDDPQDHIEPLCCGDGSLTILGNIACEMKWHHHLNTAALCVILNGDHTLWSQN